MKDSTKSFLTEAAFSFLAERRDTRVAFNNDRKLTYVYLVFNRRHRRMLKVNRKSDSFECFECKYNR